MSESGSDRGATGWAEHFGMRPEDAPLMEELCRSLLREAGLDGERFFASLAQGASFGGALGLPPEISELLYSRAHRWFSVERPDRAEPLFRTLCILDGQVADYWVGLGVCLEIGNRPKAAAYAFATAAMLRPQWAIPAYYSAAIALHSGDLAEAGQQLKRFERLADAATPDGIRAEAGRIRAALELRSGARPAV